MKTKPILVCRKALFVDCRKHGFRNVSVDLVGDPRKIMAGILLRLGVSKHG